MVEPGRLARELGETHDIGEVDDRIAARGEAVEAGHELRQSRQGDEVLECFEPRDLSHPHGDVRLHGLHVGQAAQDGVGQAQRDGVCARPGGGGRSGTSVGVPGTAIEAARARREVARARRGAARARWEAVRASQEDARTRRKVARATREEARRVECELGKGGSKSRTRRDRVRWAVIGSPTLQRKGAAPAGRGTARRTTRTAPKSPPAGARGHD